MRKITDEQIREAAEMVVFEGLTYREVADRLEFSKSTIGYHLRHTLKKPYPFLYYLVRQTAEKRKERFKHKDEGTILDNYYV